MQGGIDLAILDGEATPTGGMGIAKQLKDELAVCPPILVLTGRPDDAWLANWSRAEAAVSRIPSTPSCWAARCLGCCAPPRFAEALTDWLHRRLSAHPADIDRKGVVVAAICRRGTRAAAG